MNVKGVNPISMVFSVFVFVVAWVFLAPWIAEEGKRQVVISGLTGIEAFVYSNLNFSIFVSLAIMIVAYSFAMRGLAGGNGGGYY